MHAIICRGNVTAATKNTMVSTCYAYEACQNASHKDWNIQLVFEENITGKEKS